jgi:hypothetical protein
MKVGKEKHECAQIKSTRWLEPGGGGGGPQSTLSWPQKGGTVTKRWDTRWARFLVCFVAFSMYLYSEGVKRGEIAESIEMKLPVMIYLLLTVTVRGK